MIEPSEFWTNEQEKKEIRDNNLKMQSRVEVNQSFTRDLTGDEYREALYECGDDILELKDGLINYNPYKLRTTLEKILHNHFYDEKVKECYEKLQAQGEE